MEGMSAGELVLVRLGDLNVHVVSVTMSGNGVRSGRTRRPQLEQNNFSYIWNTPKEILNDTTQVVNNATSW